MDVVLSIKLDGEVRKALKIKRSRIKLLVKNAEILPKEIFKYREILMINYTPQELVRAFLKQVVSENLEKGNVGSVLIIDLKDYEERIKEFVNTVVNIELKRMFHYGS